MKQYQWMPSDAHVRAGERSMTDEERACRYFADRIEPGLRKDGVPDDGVALMRGRYVQGALSNKVAMISLREMYAMKEEA